MEEGHFPASALFLQAIPRSSSGNLVLNSRCKSKAHGVNGHQEVAIEAMDQDSRVFILILVLNKALKGLANGEREGHLSALRP